MGGGGGFVSYQKLKKISIQVENTVVKFYFFLLSFS